MLPPSFLRANQDLIQNQFLLNQELENNQFIAGPKYSVADITALCAIDFCVPAKIEIPENHKNLHRWIEEIKQRTSSKIM